MQANYFEGRRSLVTELLDQAAKALGLKGLFSFGEVNLQLEQNIADDENAAAKALNTLSPLVATKVLEQMTPNEIRKLGKLPNIGGGDVLQEPSGSLFAKEKDIVLERLKKLGRPASDFKSIYSHSVKENPLSKESLIAEAKSKYQTNLSEDQARTLGLISKGNDFNSIRKALDISSDRLVNIYKQLINSELITAEGQLTAEGEVLSGLDEAESIEVLYQYALRPDAPELVPGGK